MDEQQERAKFRLKRQRARKRKKIKKYVLSILGVIVVALAAFLITMKICNPDFAVETMIPNEKVQQVVENITDNIKKNAATTTTKPTTTQPTTTTRPANYDYVQFSDFEFDTSLQGNQIGNLLNKTNGSVTYNSAYIYYSIAGDGLYRFEPNEESNVALNTGNHNFKCLNILGENIYYVDSDSHKLVKSSVDGKGAKNISEDIDFAYLYNDRIYFVGTDNTVGFIEMDNNQKTVLYTADSNKTIQFVGISLSRIFFTTNDKTTNNNEYITVALADKTDKQFFMDDSKGDAIVNMQLECGYFYYYKKQSDNTFDLIRQKFGSDKTVTLLEDCNITDYPVVYTNRLYYTAQSSSNIQARELNMNTMTDKNMLTVFDASADGTIGVGYGYQYVFLFGSPQANASRVYKGSCIYTSASTDNTITFNRGNWYY